MYIIVGLHNYWVFLELFRDYVMILHETIALETLTHLEYPASQRPIPHYNK